MPCSAVEREGLAPRCVGVLAGGDEPRSAAQCPQVAASADPVVAGDTVWTQSSEVQASAQPEASAAAVAAAAALETADSEAAATTAEAAIAVERKSLGGSNTCDKTFVTIIITKLGSDRRFRRVLDRLASSGPPGRGGVTEGGV